MKENIGTIAVVMPMYNARETIVRAVQSVVNQSWQNWKLYIINDKSKDDSLDIVHQHFSDERIVILNNDINIGAAETRNAGIKAAKEKWIAFLDSDDEWDSEKLAKQAEVLADGDNITITHYRYIAKKKYTIEYNKDYLEKDKFVKKQFRVCFSSLCYRRPEQDVLFDNKGHEDFLFIFKLLSHYHRARVIRLPLVNYYELSDSLSRNKNKAAKWHLELLKTIYNGNPVKVYYYYLWYMINGVLFTIKHR